MEKYRTFVENFREILFEFRENGLSKIFAKLIEIFRRKLEFFKRFDQKFTQNLVRLSLILRKSVFENDRNFRFRTQFSNGASKFRERV